MSKIENETKETEEDPKLEELEADVSRLTETDWSEAINFLKMEQFSSRQEKYFHFLNDKVSIYMVSIYMVKL